MFNITFCQWLDSNRRPVELESTALPTVPQPLPQNIVITLTIAQGIDDSCCYLRQAMGWWSGRAKGQSKLLRRPTPLLIQFIILFSLTGRKQRTLNIGRRIRVWLTFFFKNGPNPASFCLFLFLSHDKYSTNLTINDKSIEGVCGTQTRDGRMVGADETTELWWHPIWLTCLTGFGLTRQVKQLLIQHKQSSRIQKNKQ